MVTRVMGVTDDHLHHLQETGPSRWSFARGQILRMIICKRPVPPDDICTRLAPPDDYLQEAGPSRWLISRGRSLWMIICKTPAASDDHLRLSFVVWCSLSIIFLSLFVVCYLSLFIVFHCLLLLLLLWLLLLLLLLLLFLNRVDQFLKKENHLLAETNYGCYMRWVQMLYTKEEENTIGASDKNIMI